MVGIGIGILSKRKTVGFPFALRSFWQRVRDDGGTMFDYNDVIKVYRFLATEGLIDDTELLYLSNGGAVQRVDGVLKYIRTGFDATVNENDLDGSATASQQPRLVGGIAPNSKVAASNQNGDIKLFTHTPISFPANQSWSVSFMANWNGSNLAFTAPFGSGNFASSFWLNVGGGSCRFINNSGTSAYFGNTFNLIGKLSLVTLVATGSGSLLYYVNGILEATTTVATDFIFSQLIRGYANERIYGGSFSAYHIQSGALTAAQVLAEYNLLRSLYPEIESVDIGTQTWATRNFEAVASSNGTVVPQLTTQAAWSAGTSGWSYHNGATPDTSSPNSGATYGKLYNKTAKLVLVANPPSGWHYATKAELTTLASNGGNALKYGGTNYWATTGGTNITGFTALGGSSRNADGTFNAIKETASWWCADTDEVLKVYHDSDVAEIVAADANSGHSLRLIKNA